MQDAPQHDDQNAPQPEPLDDQTLEHVAGGCVMVPDEVITPTFPTPWEPGPWIIRQGL